MLAAAALGIGGAGAESEERLRALEKEIGGARRERSAAEKETRGVLEQLEALDRESAKAAAELEQAEDALAGAGRRRAQAEAAVARLDREHERLRGRMIERAVGLHRLSRRGLAPLLFETRTDGETRARRRRHLAAIVERDLELVSAVAENRDRAARERAAAAAAEAETAKARTRRAAAVARLEKERKAKDRRLARLREAIAEKEALVGELEAAAARLRELLRRAPPKESAATLAAGRWKLPLARPDRVEKVRNGLELEAPRGTPVLAARAGRVVFSDWFVGYGRLLVLDHGGHWHTVYGSVDRVLVGTGDRVVAGQEIARVGDTGTVSRPGLYFELRRRGEPRDAASALGLGRVEKAGGDP